jgi:adenosylcobinamide kinase/adenosylcobinamide-phosphate guanylyltransferase
MADRIARHQQERGRHWQTVETPLAPEKAIVDQGTGADVILIDCLTF